MLKRADIINIIVTYADDLSSCDLLAVPAASDPYHIFSAA